MKKLLCVIALMLTASCAFGEEAAGVSAFTIQRDMGNSTGFKTSDGLQVIYIGTFRANTAGTAEDTDTETETQPENTGTPDEGIFSVFMVKSDRDTTLALDIRDGIDTRTNKFTSREGDWGYAAGSQINAMPREMSAGFWLRVTFWHTLPLKFGDRPLIARVGFVLNGNEITLKRIRPRPWGDWTYIERNYVMPLEEDSTRIEFEEMEIKPAK